MPTVPALLYMSAALATGAVALALDEPQMQNGFGAMACGDVRLGGAIRVCPPAERHGLVLGGGLHGRARRRDDDALILPVEVALP